MLLRLPQRQLALLSLISFMTLYGAFAQTAQAPPSIPPTGFAGLDQYRASRIAMFTDDYGQLARYRDANAALKPPAPGENRVVFFGDSITDIWHLDEYFPGKPYVNRGIGGQTTPQMLVRFRQDVINLQPKVVIILAGTNDIAGNTGPMRMTTSKPTTLRSPTLRARIVLRSFILRCCRCTTTPTSRKTSLPRGRRRKFFS